MPACLHIGCERKKGIFRRRKSAGTKTIEKLASTPTSFQRAFGWLATIRNSPSFPCE